jgi:metal-sulfur cluster biosynthetic enzyme
MTESPRGKELLDRLNQVIDPELGIGLVSLGRIYRLRPSSRGVHYFPPSQCCVRAFPA